MSNYNNTFIGQLAVGIWQYDLNSISSISPLTISGYMISNIGRFDNLTAQCFIGFGNSGLNFPNGLSGDGSYNYDIVDWTNPSGNLIGDTEGNILRQIYLLQYYEGLIQSMAGVGTFSNGILNVNNSLPIQSLKEGDSVITFVSAAVLGNLYRNVLDAKRKELNYMVEAYNINSNSSNTPRTLAFFNIWPAGNGGSQNY